MDSFEQLPLKDIHLPDPVSWWPLAVGWWILLTLLAVLIVAAIYWWIAGAPARRVAQIRKIARIQLQNIEADYETGGDIGKLFRDASVLLRRTAMTLFPRDQVAGLCGQAWSDWLIRHGMSTRVASVLNHAPYANTGDIAPGDFLADCHRWMQSVSSSGNSV